MPDPRSPLRCERGQASVELVAVLPALVVIAALAWQLALAGHTLIAASAAVRAAARAHALGGDARAAAHASLPVRLRRAAVVRADADGIVRVRVGIPGILRSGTLGPVTLRARFTGGRT